MTEFRFVEKTSDPQEGYKITKSSGNFTSQELTRIERQAFPASGKNVTSQWQYYKKASGLKVFSINRHEIAVSKYYIKPEKDINGRSGIIFAHVDLIPKNLYRDYLKAIYEQTLQGLNLQDKDIQKLTIPTARRLMSMLTKNKHIFTHPYESPNQWHYAEATLLKMILTDHIDSSFATMTLAPDSDVQIVVIPQKEVARNRIPSMSIPAYQ